MTTDPRTQAAARAEEQRIKDIVDRRIRETFKNGQPAGSYTSYLWDGMKIVGPGGGAGITVDAIYTMSTTNTVLGDTTPKRLNFNSQKHDPGCTVTTGSSWAFTAPATSTYLVMVNAPLSIGLGATWLVTDRADLTIQGAVNIAMCTWTGIELVGQPGNLLLSGFRGIPLDQGDVIYAQFVQDSGTNYNIDEAIASIVIAHV